MKDFFELSDSLRIELHNICLQDDYGLSPESLYKNIFNSTGSVESLMNIFEISYDLILKIKKEGKV